MNDKKRKALEKAGYRIGDAGDLLGLTAEERALVDLRIAVSRAVQEQRKKRNVTQVQLAELLNSSQSRVAKIEGGSSDVSLDLMFRSLFAIGGKIGDVLKAQPGSQSTGARKPKRRLAARTSKRRPVTTAD